MAKIIVTDRDGVDHELEGKEGWKVMEIIRDAGLPIEAACGGCCACATCHVYVDADWQSKLKAADEEEADMLDLALDVKDNSRLSCQVEFNAALDGLKVTLAPE
ncbi:2Fe-2S iron-sulfur cluster-binding protein [Alphaproteobacteria bacterium]|jgi:ferredoxin, 2Fe-2S|nr:2Fe-2S iron-sulfur cluster-binding protein [Alphaproteobacteria bacterium]